MPKRTFYFASLLAAFIALYLHGASYEARAQGSHTKAKSWKLQDAEKAQMKVEVARLRRNGTTLFYLGLAFSLSSIACLITAAVRKEPGWYSIPILLLFFGLVVQLLL
jgi:hypothetical protein